jgi:L,D-transpeptidase ErfK/SrfK
MSRNSHLSRRSLLAATGVMIASPALLLAQTPSRPQAGADSDVRRNASAFITHEWRDHFDQLGRGIIIADTNTRALQHWTTDGEMRIYPTSVPKTDELTRRGYTEVVEKREKPGWGPTPSMRERDPTLPVYVSGGDPRNPLGTRGMYLSWQYYLIHGTQDTRKIGRRSSSGCIGLYNEQVEELYERTPVGTQVKVI